MNKPTRILTTTLILRLKVEGFNGFYLQGCDKTNDYILQPTVIAGVLQNDELRDKLFARIKYFHDEEILEMVAGDDFITFLVEMPEELLCRNININ